MKKKIIILVIAIIIVVAGYYIRSLVIKAREDAKKSVQDKYLESMRDKYKDINSISDFMKGITYAKYPSVFGYDLRLVTRDKLEKITLDELKFIYETAKVGVGTRGNDNDMKFLDVMHKMF